MPERADAEALALLIAGARDAIEDLTLAVQTREHDLATYHAAQFRQYQQDIEALFLRHSVLPPAAPIEVYGRVERQWDPLAVRRAGALQGLQQSFAALMEALAQQDTEALDETLADVAEEGYLRELWLLAESGIDIDPYLDSEPEDWSPVVAANTVNGVDWMARLLMWGALTRDKVRRGVGAHIVSGHTWEETRSVLARVTSEHTDHVIGLLDNEVFRAYNVGASVARQAARRDYDVAELWVSRLLWGDTNVCLLCKSKHLTVTTDRPIDDSHPGCRCITVPLVASYTPTAIPYPTFRATVMRDR